MKNMPEDPRLVRLTKICLAFPEASRERMKSHAAFRVRKKVFVYFLSDHHGDGIVSICCKALPGDNKLLVQSDPRRFYLPAYIGSRGWIALRLDVGKIDWEEVSEIVALSYKLTAPRTLAARVKTAA